MLRKRFKESHAQGTCPICGEKIWSDEGCSEVEGIDGYVHDYHCTDESLEALQDFADEFWSTHSSEGMNYYKNAKLFDARKPKCVLRSELRESKKLTESKNVSGVSVKSFGIGNKATCRYYGHIGHKEKDKDMNIVGEIIEIWYNSKYCVCMIDFSDIDEYIIALFTHKNKDLSDCKFVIGESIFSYPDAKDLFEDYSRFPYDYE